jgi:hypothetical protein
MMLRWLLCRVGRHFFVTLDIDGGELDGEHTFCLWCGLHAHE